MTITAASIARFFTPSAPEASSCFQPKAEKSEKGIERAQWPRPGHAGLQDLAAFARSTSQQLPSIFGCSRLRGFRLPTRRRFDVTPSPLRGLGAAELAPWVPRGLKSGTETTLSLWSLPEASARLITASRLCALDDSFTARGMKLGLELV